MTTARRSWQRVLVIAITAALLTAAQASEPGAQPLPTLTDEAVNDFANVVDPGAEAEIDRWVRSLIRASKDYVYIVTVDTYAPFGSIEEYAVRLFEHAKIGTRERDNGVLIVLAVKDRRVRIEAGYGLEEFITDGFAGETIRQAMLPEFREGRYGQGLLNGVIRTVRRIADGRGVTLSDVPAPVREIQPRPLPAWVVPVGLLIFILVVRAISRGTNKRSRFLRRRRGGTWSGWHGGVGGFGGGGFGGGFGGFGGGGGGGGGGLGGFGGGRSGGGGASGGW